MENKLQKFKDNDKEEYYKGVIERLQKEIKIKEGMIDEERNNAASQKKFYETQYKQKIKKDEDSENDGEKFFLKEQIKMVTGQQKSRKKSNKKAKNIIHNNKQQIKK